MSCLCCVYLLVYGGVQCILCCAYLCDRTGGVMVCVIAEKFSCWRLATITQNITLNKSAICTEICSKCKLISTVSKFGIMLHVLRRNISPFGELLKGTENVHMIVQDFLFRRCRRGICRYAK
jgi:hypothetical protein